MRGQQAQAALQGAPQCPGVRGLIRFTAHGPGTIVEVHVQGLPGGRGCATRIFGLEIHENGDCTPCRGRDPFCFTGGPFSPCRASCRSDGDLLPLLASDGEAMMTYYTGAFAVRDILGHSIVILMDSDEPRCGPVGVAIACGVIRPARPDCDCSEPCRPDSCKPYPPNPCMPMPCPPGPCNRPDPCRPIPCPPGPCNRPEPCRPSPCNRPEPCRPCPCKPDPCYRPAPCPPVPWNPSPCWPEPCGRWTEPARISDSCRCQDPAPWPWR